MKINAELVQEMRLKKSWSQEELAISTGLNLRTIQRIEREGTASLQSRKALASAFEISIEDLDSKEVRMTKKFEFKTIEIDSNEGFLTGIAKPKLPNFTEIFNLQGQEGWSLVQILSPELAQGLWSGKSGKFVALLQRELIE
ncbi:helix-turn-helix domain-containing protein [Reinekea forsetii]|nr:helix-turn-helix domain-containing protein [Reinekea forsetii]